MKEYNFNCERWDINRLVNEQNDLFALVILWQGRANDIDEILDRNPSMDIGEIKRLEGTRDAYFKTANEIRQALNDIKENGHENE